MRSGASGHEVIRVFDFKALGLLLRIFKQALVCVCGCFSENIGGACVARLFWGPPT